MVEKNVYFKEASWGLWGLLLSFQPCHHPIFLNNLPSTPLTTLCLHLTLDYSFLFFPKPPVNNRKPEVRELEVLYIGGGSEPGKGEK